MLIFTIPIYSYKESEINEKFDSFVREKAARIDTSEIDANQFVNAIYPNLYVYDNYIIGFIKIYYNNGELNYELLNTYSKRAYSSKTRERLASEIINSIYLSDDQKELHLEGIKKAYNLTQYIIPFTSQKKHYMEIHKVAGYHTMIEPHFTNEEIKELIEHDLYCIEKSELNKKVYVDKKLFNNLIDCIDFKKLFMKAIEE